jgi:histidine triad (HIT) family protein
MNGECVFCKIVTGKAPARKVYQDEQITAFHDTRPATPVHILVIPNHHIASVNDLTEADEPLMGRLFTIARQIAQEQGIAESGYRLIMNTGPHAGQAVFHIHLHILGGQRMRYPMG